MVVKKIEQKVGTILMNNDVNDKWVWLGDKEEKYSTKEGYQELNIKEGEIK